MLNHHTFFNIHGQTAIITGGSGILGSAMAHGLAQAGANVAVIGLHEEKTSAVADQLPRKGAKPSPSPATYLSALTCNMRLSR